MAMMIMRFYKCSFDVKDLFIHFLVNYVASLSAIEYGLCYEDAIQCMAARWNNLPLKPQVHSLRVYGELIVRETLFYSFIPTLFWTITCSKQPYKVSFVLYSMQLNWGS